MKTIYFIRHGQSVTNDTGVFQGDDDPLTELGHAQAEHIARRCTQLQLEALIASTMLRAQQTAEHISKATGLKIESSDDVVERKAPNVLIGHSRNESESFELHKKWTDSLISDAERVLDGETFSDMRGRVESTMDMLKARGESHIAVVTHGFFLRMVAARVILGGDFTIEEFKQFFRGMRSNNTGITVVQSAPENDLWKPWMEGQEWILRCWNDRAHLG